MDKEQSTKYLIHLKDGAVVKLGGIPYRVFGEADLGGNTKPTEEVIGMKVDYEEIEEEESEGVNK